MEQGFCAELCFAVEESLEPGLRSKAEVASHKFEPPGWFKCLAKFLNKAIPTKDALFFWPS